jgi:2'-5' RNA ligase
MARRLFLAAHLPRRTAEELAAYAARAAPKDARLPPVENLHVTVHFLGRVEVPPEEVAAALTAACAGSEPFTLRLVGGVWTPRRRPRMLWAAIEPHPSFAQLAQSAAAALEPLVPSARPPRPGKPHVTLARLRSSPDGEPSALELDDPLVPVDQVDVVESLLSPRGARYETLAAVPLGRP